MPDSQRFPLNLTVLNNLQVFFFIKKIILIEKSNLLNDYHGYIINSFQSTILNGTCHSVNEGGGAQLHLHLERNLLILWLK